MSEDKMPVFVETREFWWPVRVELPGDDGFESQEFEARMQILPDSEFLDKLGDQVKAGNALDFDREIIGKAVSGLRGIKLNGISEADALTKMAQMAPYRLGLVKAVFDAHTGGKARTGN